MLLLPIEIAVPGSVDEKSLQCLQRGIRADEHTLIYSIPQLVSQLPLNVRDIVSHCSCDGEEKEWSIASDRADRGIRT
jgi:hypothetical protein